MDQANPQLADAIEAVGLACSVTRRVQRELGSIVRLTKDDRSPVTVADFAAQAVIARVLHRREQRLDLVGEESSAALREEASAAVREAVLEAVRRVWPDATTTQVLDAIDYGNHDASAAQFWTLDPVDGTKGFIRGQQYAISLARIEQGQVVLGVLGCPNLSADFAADFNQPDPTGLVFYAVRGCGAWCVPAGQRDAAPVRVSVAAADRGPIRMCESVEAEHSKQDDTARILAHLGGSGTPARLDSQCKYAVVARGQADAYLRLPTRKGYVEKIWDHAAGDIIAREAGAIVTDINGRPLDFSLGATLAGNRGIVCASPAFHARILAAIRALDIRSPD